MFMAGHLFGVQQETERHVGQRPVTATKRCQYGTRKSEVYFEAMQRCPLTRGCAMKPYYSLFVSSQTWSHHKDVSLQKDKTDHPSLGSLMGFDPADDEVAKQSRRVISGGVKLF